MHWLASDYVSEDSGTVIINIKADATEKTLHKVESYPGELYPLLASLRPTRRDRPSASSAFTIFVALASSGLRKARTQ
jgi:hypothetical protein